MHKISHHYKNHNSFTRKILMACIMHKMHNLQSNLEVGIFDLSGRTLLLKAVWIKSLAAAFASLSLFFKE